MVLALFSWPKDLALRRFLKQSLGLPAAAALLSSLSEAAFVTPHIEPLE
jgi:hypothetical protein